MYTDTVFGVKWRDSVASTEVILTMLVIGLALAVYFLLKYNQTLKNRKLQAQLLFQIKIKQFGLTGLQNRIVNNIIELRQIQDPHSIFTSPGLFEESIGDLLLFLKGSTENGESLVNICKDLIITYEKLYHHAQVRKPIEKISDIEEGGLLYFYLRPSVIYVGKLVEKKDTEMTLQLFRSIKDLPPIETGKNYSFFLWRSGDAEYIFSSAIVSIADGRITIGMPGEFTRGREVRRPYVDVIVPCTVTVSDSTYRGDPNPPEPMSATILKLNEHEAVMRHSKKLDYRYAYALAFELDEFRVNAVIRVIADKTITEGNVHYQTCKFTEVSEAAKAVLHNFVIDRF